MEKKYIFIICMIVILGLFVIISKINMNKPQNSKTQNKNTIPKSEIQYDEKTGYYYVRDEETGEIRGASKEEMELKIYIDNPDYDSDPFTTNPKDLNEYIENLEVSSESYE